MKIRNFTLATIAAGAMLVSGAASAAALSATFNPMANNGGAGVLDAATAAFTAVGFASDLDSTLTINSNVGAGVMYTETGNINITSFITAANLPALSNVGPTGNYNVFGNFTLSGLGNWAGSQFTATPGTATFTLNLFGQNHAPLSPLVSLGTASIDPFAPQVAFAIAFGSVAANSTGTALTSLSAGLNFLPAAGTEGATGFFQAPNPFKINLAIGNAGGNNLNTGYSVSAGGVVTFVTPLPGTNNGTANVTFQAIPEPAALALVGLALAGAGVASRRKVTAKA